MEVKDREICDRCGCRTNAKLRRCCNDGYQDDMRAIESRMGAAKIRQFDEISGTVQLRRHMELKEGSLALDGQRVRLTALWIIEDDDSRYPREWALGPADGATKDMLDAAGVTWIASGDVCIVSATYNFGQPESAPTPTRPHAKPE